MDQDVVMQEIFDLADPYIRQVRDLMLAATRKVITADDADSIMGVQMELKDLLAGRQDGIAEIDRLLAADKAEMKRRVRAKPFPRMRVKDLQDRVARRERRLIREEALRHVHRCVADGLAWRAMSYRREVFAVFGQGARVGRFSNRPGLTAEFERAQEIWDSGALPLLNDMTNVLRTGDLTVLHTRWPDAEVTVEEVKAGRGSRGGRQTALREWRQRLFDDGWAPADAGQIATGLWWPPVAYRHHLDVLPGLFAEARATGFAAAAVHPAMIVSAAALNRESGSDGCGPAWTERGAVEAGWVAAGHPLITNSAISVRVQERRHAGPAGLAPIAAFPLSAEDVVDVLVGSLDYVVSVDLTQLDALFAASDIDVEYSARGGFFRAKRGGHAVTLPSVIREQVLRETMDPDCLVALTESMLEGVESGLPDGAWILLMDETEAWRNADRSDNS